MKKRGLEALLEAQERKFDRLSSLLEKQTELFAGVVAPSTSVAPSPTLSEIWPEFEVAERHRLRSWRDYEQRWVDHVEPFFGSTRADEVDIPMVDRYRARRLKEPTAKRGTPTKLATVNLEIAIVRRLISFGRKRGRVTISKLHGPGMTRELIHRPNNIRTTIVEERPEAEITLAKFLEAADPWFRAYMILVHQSGMRRSEAARLRWDRIDWDSGLAWIPDRDTKGGVGGRHIPIFPEGIDAISALPRYRRCPAIFTNAATMKPFHPDSWTKRFRKLCDSLDLVGPDGPPWLHDLRRSFITLARRRGESESDIMKVSGQKTRSSFDRYNVIGTQDVIAFRTRTHERRSAELAGTTRKPPQRIMQRDTHTPTQRPRFHAKS